MVVYINDKIEHFSYEDGCGIIIRIKVSLLFSKVFNEVLAWVVNKHF